MQPLNVVVSPEGKLPEYISKKCGEIITSLAGKHIKIKIWEAEESPSDKQRKYYFAVIVHKFIQHFAREENEHYTKDDMHNSLMRSVGGFKKPFVNAFTGDEQDGRLSYNDLSVKAAESYHLLCRKKAAELGFDIPEPNEPEAIKLMDNYR